MELLPANMGGGDSMPTAGGPTLPNEFATVDAVQKASTTSSSSSSNNATTATTKTNQGNTVDDEEEESNVLASVHASLHEQTAYEGRVLREASLHGMPSLVLLPTLLKSVGGGKFPDAPVLLASLLPTDDATDNAFGKKQQGTNRKRQTPSNNNNLAARLDRSRVHQLRTMLQAIRIQLQQEDSQSLLDNNNSMALSSSLLSDVTTTSSNVLRMKEQILSHILSSLPPSMVSSLLDDVDATNSKCETERGSHTQKPRVTWQEPEPATGRSEAATGTVPRRRRVPIMHRRQQQPYELDGDAAGVASTPAPHDKEIKRHEPERISNLRRARVERTRRKDNRRRQINPSQSFGDDNHGHCSEEKEEREMDSAATESLSTIATIRMDGSVVAQSQGDGTASKIAPANDSSIVVVSSSLNNDVICPECHARLTVDESSDGDAILAHHMMSEFCGDGSRKSRRLQQQRKQQAPVQTPVSTLRPTRNSNAVVDESDDDDDGDETFMDIFQADEDDDESVLPMRQPRSGTAKQATERSGTSINDTRTSVIRPPTNSVTIDDFNEWDYEDRVDDWILNGLDRMKIMRERDGKEELPGALEHDGGLLIPAWINDRLFGYQREGLEWMWDLHQRKQAGGIIGDEMGLGKTVQIASFLGAAASSRKLQSVLIVAPATILQHWLTELAIWAPGLRRVLLHTSGGDVGGSSRSISAALLMKLSKWLKKARMDRVNEAIDEEDWNSIEPHSFCGTAYTIVTTYENLRRNIDLYARHDWSYIVLDEAQKIRNPDADITLACKRIRTRHRLAMSGTPIQNDLRELWSLFDFVFPGRLGTLPTFEQEFAVPIKRGGYSNASPMQVQLAYRCAIMLRDLIEPYLLRRLKKDVKEVSRMPGKTEHVLFCRLSSRQRAMYEAYLLSDDVRSVIRGGTQLLAAVTMLRKIANHPDLVCDPDEYSLADFIKNRRAAPQSGSVDDDSSNEDGNADNFSINEATLLERSGKLEVLAKVLPLWKRQGHRVLIFCQWRKMLNIIERFMIMNDWKFGRLDGNTNIASRQRLVDSFNNDESYFGMLCTTRTGGVGLNLIGANRCVIYDPDWNPSGDAQARERAWRFGQEKEVTVYRLITAGTIEEKIYQRQIFKTALSNKVLQDPKQRRLFSHRDLRDLFTLTADTGSVRSGADGITETSKVTRGIGVVDTTTDLSSENDDNEATLKNVMKSKGLAGIFDHHSVEPDHKRKSTTVLEMEVHAKRVAKEAAKALTESVGAKDPFQPTWTGSEETRQGRFGPTRHPTNESMRGDSSHASGAASGALASSSLLASLRQRNSAVASVGRTDAPDDATQKYARLLGRLKEFIHLHKPTTEEILKEFECVPDSDVAIFKRLLRSVASIEGGKWKITKT